MVKVNVTDNPVKVSVKPINTVCKVMFAEKGKDGAPGFSPVVDVVEIEGGIRITVTDAKGSKTVDVMDGQDGVKGDPFTYEDFTAEQLEGLKPKAISLPSGTDFDNLKDIGRYTGDASARTYVHCPFSSGTFDLEVVSQGPSGQRKQIATAANKKKNIVAVRFFYQNSWGEWSYLHIDTGWLDCTLADGRSYGTESPYLKARYKNGVVSIKGQVTGITASWQYVAYLPAAVKNFITEHFRTIALYDMSAYCGILISLDGSIRVTENSKGSWATSNFGVNLNINIAV